MFHCSSSIASFSTHANCACLVTGRQRHRVFQRQWVSPRLPSTKNSKFMQEKGVYMPSPRAASSNSQTAATESLTPRTAKAAVEQGLILFSKGEVAESQRLFELALKLSPNSDEARAALYNAACCYTKQKQWQKATDAVANAINDYDLKITVALEDPDLAALRERREWLDALPTMKGGLTDEAFNALRTEAKAPFRLTRIILLGGLLGGASIGLLIIITRLVAAVAGGDNAPDLTETLQNFAINSAAVAALGFIVRRDVQSQERDKAVIEREESLAKLQISLGPDKQVPLATLRGVVRPVIIGGTATHISQCLRAAQPFYQELRERGVSIVAIPTQENDTSSRLKQLKKEFSSSAPSKGFSSSKPTIEEERVITTKDSKWQLEAYDVQEWRRWIEEQKKQANVTGDNLFVQVQLDGTVRSSGLGIPPWAKFVGDLPEMDSVRTKFTDGIGRM